MMGNFLTAYGGKLLEFGILVGSAATVAGATIGVSPKGAALITFGVAVLKIAESVFVPDQARVAAATRFRAA